MGQNLVELQIRAGILAIEPLPTRYFKILHVKEVAARLERECAQQKIPPGIAVQYESHIEVDENEFVNPRGEAYYDIDNKNNVIVVRVPPILDETDRTNQLPFTASAYANLRGISIEEAEKLMSAEMRAEPTEDGNKYIEEYLEASFKEYALFIKQWLAAYCYTNFRRLPLILLQGPTSSGKSTFAEWVMSFFQSMSMQWGGEESNFSYQAEKKLLVIEENAHIGSVKQYKTLKHYLGAERLPVHQKYRAPYMVKNNVNMIMTSNNAISVYMQPEEVDTDMTRNKFFVYKMTRPAKVDDDIRRKLRRYAGGYIRTALFEEFRDNIRPKMNQYRFTIPVPATDALRNLITANEPVELTLFIDLLDFLIKWNEPGTPFLKEPLFERGVLTNEAARKTYRAMTGTAVPAGVLQKWRHQLRDAGYIEHGTTRFTISGVTIRGYQLTTKLLQDRYCNCSSFKDLEGIQGEVQNRNPSEAEDTGI